MGIASPREFYSRVTSSEVTDWMAFLKTDGPPGGKRLDLAAGIIAATVANVNRGKSQKPFSPADFVPDFDDRPKQSQSWEEQMALVEQMKAAVAERDQVADIKINPEGES